MYKIRELLYFPFARHSRLVLALTGFFIFHFSFCANAQHYVLYGEAATGGSYNDGVLYRFDPFTRKDTVLFNFNGSNGYRPYGFLNLLSNRILYGICGYGGSQNEGVLFCYNLLTNNENTIINFIGSNGADPGWGMILNSGVLYGTTGYGGKYGAGVIYSYNPASNKDTVVFDFNDTDGYVPYGSLFILNDTSFYGMTGEGGLHHDGVIYRFNPLTNTETVLFSFNGTIDGADPDGSFIKDSNGLLYGMTADLGPGGGGTLLSFNSSTENDTTLIDFNGTNGKNPFEDLFLATDSLLYGLTGAGGSEDDGVLFSYNVNTNNYNVVINFDSINGSFGGGDLIEDTVNKILYGMTLYGGKYNDGVLFCYNLITKKDSVLLNFNGTNGANPQGTLLLVHDTLTGTGINEVSSTREEVKVYPNPNDGLFTIVIASVAKQSLSIIEVYNVLGEKVFTSTLPPPKGGGASSAFQINLSSQPSGVYLYRVIDENGGLVGEGKIVIEK